MTAPGGGNPLVAPRVDSTTGVDGLWLLEAIRDLRHSIDSESWVDPAVAIGGAGLETLGLIVDPVGSLAGMGVAWLIEHVQPLSQALELLAGDPDQITAHAHTWTNISTQAQASGEQLARAVNRDLADWTGQAADAYRAHIAAHTTALTGIARAAAGIAQATQGAAQLVAAVRMIVRDLVAEAVATIAARLPAWAAMTGGTLGLATPWVIAQVANLVAEWVNRIHRFLSGLLNSLTNLAPLLARLTDLLAQQRTMLDRLTRHDPTIARMSDTGTGPPSSQPSRDLPHAGPPRPRDDLNSESARTDEAGAVEGDTVADASADQARRLRELGMDPDVQRYRSSEAETALRVERLREVTLTRAGVRSGFDWVDQHGRTYDAVGNFEAKHFGAQWPQLQNRIVDHLIKADYVPVDVSRFAPEQIEVVRQFINDGDFAPRVFLVGE